MRPIDADRMVDAAFESAVRFMAAHSRSGKFIAQTMLDAVVAAALDAPTLTEDEWNEWRAANESVDGN